METIAEEEFDETLITVLSVICFITILVILHIMYNYILTY